MISENLSIKFVSLFQKNSFKEFKIYFYLFKKERKKDYERHTVKYCTTMDKYLASSQSSKKDKNEEFADSKEVSHRPSYIDFKLIYLIFPKIKLDKDVKEENMYFYKKCLDYILCIQEFEEKWFHFFAESVRTIKFGM
jgi:hypothetical protein